MSLGGVTIGSLCTGYGGLDKAAEQVTGGTTVWHCENDAAPSRLLARRYPGVRNFGDLKPFSAAGKRLGTEDPRHLFPFIAMGIAKMRPPLVLLENVRGHLTLGFDVVLAELDRLGYDVRWMLLRAADIGAPHGRPRLWIAARAREVGGWPTPTGQPVARIDGDTWVEADDGLFGAVPLLLNSNGSVPLWPAGALVDGLVWDDLLLSTSAADRVPLLPTPEAKLGSSGPDFARAGRTGSGGDDLTTTVHRHLLPTPSAVDGLGGHLSRSGDRADELLLPGIAKAMGDGQLLPTPTAKDATNSRGFDRDGRPYSPTSGVTLHDAADRLLPTPTTQDASNLAGPSQFERNSLPLNAAVTLLPAPRATDGTKGGPNQRGSSGDLMLPSAVMQQMQPGQLLPTPMTDPDSHNGNARNLGSEVRQLLPTPSPFHLENTESPDEWLARRAEVQERTGTRHGPALPVVVQSVVEGHPLVQDGDGPHRVDVGAGDAWGPYSAAIARWEALFRPAPSPHQPGRNGPQLSPRFVEWMQGLPDRWVTDPELWADMKPAAARSAQLTMLGNGVVWQCGAVAFRLLGVSPEVFEVAA